MSTALADAAVRIRVGLSLRDADPLAFWRWSVPRMRQALNLFTDLEPIQELGIRGPNKSGKTRQKAAFVIRCCQKFDELDGVKLPHWRGPVEAVQLCLDYKQQLLSVKPAYLALLGDWPHKVRLVGEVLASIRIKPRDCASDNELDWSVIHFLTEENRTTGVGVRADIVDIDEPAVMEILRELRKAAHAGRRLVILHGFTPTKRREYFPVREDYGDTPRRCIRRIDRLKAEVRWSMDEVLPHVLTDEEKRDLWDSYSGDPLFGEDGGARWHGDYTNTDGVCPFDADTIVNVLMPLCREPEIVTQPIPMESMDGRPVTVERAPVKVWKKAERNKRYYSATDPASGAEGNHHLGLLGSEFGSGDLCAYWSGYMAPYCLGVLQAINGRQYNNALADVEMNDKWGVNVVRGLNASRYPNQGHEVRTLRPGVFSKEVGYGMKKDDKKEIIGAIQEWLAAWKAGIGYAFCPSMEILQSILDCELDDDGKIVAGDGVAHGVGWMLWGRSLRQTVRRSNVIIPQVQREPQTADQRVAAMIRGERPRNGNGNGNVNGRAVMRPRGRP